jgi:hypothetical protein
MNQRLSPHRHRWSSQKPSRKAVMVAQAAVMAAAAATDAVDAMTTAAKAVVRVVRMAAVKAVARHARPAMSNAQKAAVKPKANATAATAVVVTTAMSVANAVATTASSAQSAWTLMPRHLARSCQSQPMHALSAPPATSVVASAVNVVKAVAANATKTAHRVKTVVSATPKAVLTKPWHHAKIATMRSHLLTDATSNVAAMDVAAMDAATSAVLAKTKAVTTLSSLKPTWHFQNLQRHKAMRRSLNKARTQKRQQRRKAKAANLVSLVHAIVMVVTVAIALTVRSTLRRTPSPGRHKLLLRLRQYRLLSVWLRSPLLPLLSRQWL